MRAILISIAVAVSSAGCLQISPVDGSLLCSTVGNQCPGGYYCANDNTCWHMGKAPGGAAGGHDMSIDHDGGNPGVDGGGNTGSDGGAVMMSCTLPSDCPAPTMPCLLQACIGGACALVAAPTGTPLPASSQVAHDCVQLVCDANGNPTPTPDTTDTPLDPSGGCTTPSCNGATPELTPTASGTSCTKMANGICNGNGVCGACKPGATQCKGTTAARQQCNAQGQWVDFDTCPNACTGGVCTGSCNAASPAMCGNSTTLQTCVSNQWASTDCTQGGTTVCSTQSGTAKCQGTCTPTAASCNSAGHLVGCDNNGNPTDDNCTTKVAGGWCVNNQCTACQPTATQCTGGGSYETCDSNGVWQSASCASSYPSGTWTCTNSGSGLQQASCSCSDATDHCGSYECGNVTNNCGVAVSCGICSTDYRCSTHTCVPINTTQTTKTTCPCGGTAGHCMICM
jgi:hypothetical protein